MSAVYPQRDPDQIQKTSAETSYLFEDLTETCSIKADALLRICAPVHWPLFQKSMFDADYRARTGLAGIIYWMDLSVTDAVVAMPRTVSATVDVELSLGRSADSDPRIISHGEMKLSCAPSDGRFGRRPDPGARVHAGTLQIDHVLTRISAPPDQRRVRELPDDLGFTKKLPGRILPFVQAEEILRPPEPFSVRAGDYRDERAKFWTYNRTDPNQHIHAMDYVRAAEDLATDALAVYGLHPAGWFFDRISVLYKRPMFTGDAHIRSATVWTPPGTEAGRAAVTLAFYSLKHPKDTASFDPAKPCVCVRFTTAPRSRTAGHTAAG